MENRKIFYSTNMFRVCIDDYQVDICGRVYSPMSQEEVGFAGIGEMLLKMDKLFDSIGYPQAFQNKRSFEEEPSVGNAYRGIPKPVRETDSIVDKEGKHCTYDVMVESRRNTSWQGSVYDIDGMEKGKFNGEVELLRLLSELVKK